jgi:hypothetical protein
VGSKAAADRSRASSQDKAGNRAVEDSKSPDSRAVSSLNAELSSFDVLLSRLCSSRVSF